LLLVSFGCTQTKKEIKQDTALITIKETSTQTQLKTECNTGESRPCIAIKDCPGIQECVNGTWQKCRDSPYDNCPKINSAENACKENWQCNEWSECSKGVQTRKCIDSSKCGTEFNMPDTIKLCK